MFSPKLPGYNQAIDFKKSSLCEYCTYKNICKYSGQMESVRQQLIDATTEKITEETITTPSIADDTVVTEVVKTTIPAQIDLGNGIYIQLTCTNYLAPNLHVDPYITPKGTSF